VARKGSAVSERLGHGNSRKTPVRFWENIGMEGKSLSENGTVQAVSAHAKVANTKKRWQKPKLEDVSGKVMAQPYIRFT
jgi:hypothetical protein